MGGAPNGRAPAAPRDALIVANLKLAWWVARRLAGDDEDAKQVAVIGLMRAVEKFDPGLGFKFSSYAVWWVRAYVGRYLQRERRWSRRCTSLDAPGPDGEEPLVESIAHPGPAPDATVALRGIEQAAVEGLRGRARAIGADVLALRVFADEPATLEVIGGRHGVSREYARQVECKVRERLRAA